MAKITAKVFMASVMGLFELLICEGCKNLLFGAGKVSGIKKLERPKFCPYCGCEVDIQFKALSSEEVMSYAVPLEEKLPARCSTVRSVGLNKTLLECSGCKGQFEWSAFENHPKGCPHCGARFANTVIKHPVKM